jgi:drug/metabolite transporter (DMT)-like permease
MTVPSFLQTIACVVGIAIGQILFKLAARDSAHASALGGLLNGWLVAALILYGGATLLWVYVLRSVPLSIAYPLFALAFVIVPVLSATFLDEPLGVSSFIGGALIIAGVYISTQGNG